MVRKNRECHGSTAAIHVRPIQAFCSKFFRMKGYWTIPMTEKIQPKGLACIEWLRR